MNLYIVPILGYVLLNRAPDALLQWGGGRTTELTKMTGASLMGQSLTTAGEPEFRFTAPRQRAPCVPVIVAMERQGWENTWGLPVSQHS